MVEPPETTFVKKTETWFTLIEIHTIVKNRKYAAKFKTTVKFFIINYFKLFICLFLEASITS